MHFHEAIVEVHRMVSDARAELSELRSLVKELSNRPQFQPTDEEAFSRDILLAMVRCGESINVEKAKTLARQFYTGEKDLGSTTPYVGPPRVQQSPLKEVK